MVAAYSYFFSSLPLISLLYVFFFFSYLPPQQASPHISLVASQVTVQCHALYAPNWTLLLQPSLLDTGQQGSECPHQFTGPVLFNPAVAVVPEVRGSIAHQPWLLQGDT